MPQEPEDSPEEKVGSDAWLHRVLDALDISEEQKAWHRAVVPAWEWRAYPPRYDGPDMSHIWFHDPIRPNEGFEMSDAAAEAWDELCDANPPLVAWFQAHRDALGSAGGAMTLFVGDGIPERLTRSRDGSTTLRFPIERIRSAHKTSSVFQYLILRLLTSRAEQIGVSSPPATG